MKIIVTGANGQLGNEFRDLANQYPEWNFLFCGSKELDITNEAAVAVFFKNANADYCLNCAAYTAVDQAESEIEKATAVNVTAVKNLAKAASKYKCHLFHYSSDYVYHNQINRPLVETDPTLPSGVYAQTKLKGDQLAIHTYDGVTVLRTSWVYSSHGHNFVKTMLRLGKERKFLRVVFDQIGTPTYAGDLAKATLDLIQKVTKEPILFQKLPGIFHFSNEGVASWYDFAKAIFDLSDIDIELQPILSKEYPTPAERPTYSVLSKEKIKQAFELEIPHWRDSLQKCLTKIKSRKSED